MNWSSRIITKQYFDIIAQSAIRPQNIIPDIDHQSIVIPDRDQQSIVIPFNPKGYCLEFEKEVKKNFDNLKKMISQAKKQYDLMSLLLEIESAIDDKIRYYSTKTNLNQEQLNKYFQDIRKKITKVEKSINHFFNTGEYKFVDVIIERKRKQFIPDSLIDFRPINCSGYSINLDVFVQPEKNITLSHFEAYVSYLMKNKLLFPPKEKFGFLCDWKSISDTQNPITDYLYKSGCNLQIQLSQLFNSINFYYEINQGGFSCIGIFNYDIEKQTVNRFYYKSEKFLSDVFNSIFPQFSQLFSKSLDIVKEPIKTDYHFENQYQLFSLAELLVSGNKFSGDIRSLDSNKDRILNQILMTCSNDYSDVKQDFFISQQLAMRK